LYCRKIVAHARNEQLLMHFFQDNVAGIALNQYMHLEPARIHSWKDLVDAFLKQYKYDMAPDRIQLQGMAKKKKKKSFKTFKECAQR